MDLAFAPFGSVTASSEEFDCGEPELNSFLRDEAARFVKKGLSAVQLLVDRDTWRVVGFYAIAPSVLALSFLTDEQKKAYNVPFPIPSWLIGRLAVDVKYQGLRLGNALLAAAIADIKKRAAEGAGSCIVVDAKNRKVKKFYKKFNFNTLIGGRGLKLIYEIAK